MLRAVQLAEEGLGSTYPNPSVGALVVSDGVIVGEGRSAPTGGQHAEVRALRQAGARARGATIYVTLEPCCHVGRTGPCTEAIISAGIARVVIGIRDPATHARGKGLETLIAAGLEVEEGVEAGACARAHEHYLHHVETGRPFVSLKAATSLDGRLATVSGDSRWITSEASRTHVHRLRAQHHSILVGVETVLRDDPRLDVRMVDGTDPIPVVLDSRLRLGGADVDARAVLRPGTLVMHTAAADAAARDRIATRGVMPVEIAGDVRGRVDVAALLVELGRRQIRSVLVEGGGQVHGSFVGAGHWDRLFLFVAPKILGEGTPMIAGVSWERVADTPALWVEARQFLEDDLLTVVRPGVRPHGGPRRASGKES